MKAKTFGELEGAKSVTFEELQNSLEDYANGGWAISARVVKKIVNKMNFSLAELNKLIASASKGVDNQTRRHQVEAAGEYQRLIYFLREKSSLQRGL